MYGVDVSPAAPGVIGRITVEFLKYVTVPVVKLISTASTSFAANVPIDASDPLST